MDNELVSMRAYARMRSVALSTIQGAVAAGRIALTADGRIDVAAADAGWHAGHLARKPGSGRPGPTRTTHARVEAAAAKVQLASHRLEELEAAYINRETTRAALREDVDAVLDAIRRLPESGADAFAKAIDRDPASARRVLTTLVGALLDELSDAGDLPDAVLRDAA